MVINLEHLDCLTRYYPMAVSLTGNEIMRKIVVEVYVAISNNNPKYFHHPIPSRFPVVFVNRSLKVEK